MGERSGSAVLVPADLLDTGALPGLVEAAVRGFGRLDALVNNASSFYATPLGSVTERAWDDLMGTNLKAPLFLAQAAVPHLRASGGCIVNIVDIHADFPLANYAVYVAAKGGLAALTRQLARDVGPEVRVNGVAPGAILWPEAGEWQDEESAPAHPRALGIEARGRAGRHRPDGRVPDRGRALGDGPDHRRRRRPEREPVTAPLPKQRYEANKLAKRLRRQVGEAIADYSI